MNETDKKLSTKLNDQMTENEAPSMTKSSEEEKIQALESLITKRNLKTEILVSMNLIDESNDLLMTSMKSVDVKVPFASQQIAIAAKELRENLKYKLSVGKYLNGDQS